MPDLGKLADTLRKAHQDDEDLPDDIYAYDEDEHIDDYVCLFPGECCMPDPHHHRDECHTAEMMVEQERAYDMYILGESFVDSMGGEPPVVTEDDIPF